MNQFLSFLLLLTLAGCVLPSPHYTVAAPNGPGYLPAYPDRDQIQLDCLRGQ